MSLRYFPKATPSDSSKVLLIPLSIINVMRESGDNNKLGLYAVMHSYVLGFFYSDNKKKIKGPRRYFPHRLDFSLKQV